MNHRGSFPTVIIGLGNIGLGLDLHSPENAIFTHVKACMKHEAFEVLAGVDPNSERRREFEAYTGLRAFESLEATGLRQGQAALIIIATPPQVRLTIVEQSLALKPRAILVEKPLALSEKEAGEIVKLCEDHGVLLAVNYFRYFAPKLQRIGGLIQENKFGSLGNAVCHYSSGILNNASHFISYLVQWLGTPASVHVFDGGLLLPSGEFNACFRLEFNGGSVWFLPQEGDYGIGEVDLFFSEGRILLKNYGEEVEVFRSAPDPIFAGYRRLRLLKERPEQPHLNRYQYDVLSALEQALQTNSAASLNGANALETLRISLRILDEAQGSARIP